MSSYRNTSSLKITINSFSFLFVSNAVCERLIYGNRLVQMLVCHVLKQIVSRDLKLPDVDFDMMEHAKVNNM